MAPNKPKQPSNSSPPKRPVTATRTSRKLLLQRLREIDRLNRKELAALMEDAERLKRKLHGDS